MNQLRMIITFTCYLVGTVSMVRGHVAGVVFCGLVLIYLALHRIARYLGHIAQSVEIVCEDEVMEYDDEPGLD